MLELIGLCDLCGKEVYCENGFFDGGHQEGKLLCRDCNENTE